ncbi:MAG: peptidoglycan bridge formation glycyltransferase FemA/FemB family protein [Candidatus Saccharibacteria bacterium]|nr:peptidoglycan bridge formation glycyltransferase FemA/FemB family protein [Candidatus Saccharibacteria bacterium]
MKLAEISEKEFEKFASGSGGSFLQSVEMYERYVDRKNEVYILGLLDGKTVKAAGIFVCKFKKMGQKIFTCPRGFLMDYAAEDAEEIFTEFTTKVKEFLKQKQGMALTIAPNVVRKVEIEDDGKVIREKWELGDKIAKMCKSQGFKALGEYEFVKWIYALDTSGLNEDNLLASFRKDHRATIKHATSRYAMRLRELGMDELELLDETVHATGERRGFSDPGVKYYQEMAKHFGDKVKFVVAEAPKTVIEAFISKDKEKIAEACEKANKILGDNVWRKGDEKIEMQIVAGAMFVMTDDEIVYLYSGSYSQYKKLGGPHLIQYEMIKEAAKRGVKKYNFYGVEPLPDNGVYEFKRGFHGHVEEYVGTFMVPLTVLGKVLVGKQKYEEIRALH